MKTASEPLTGISRLRLAVEREKSKLRGMLEYVDRILAESDAVAMLEKVHRVQHSSAWLEELRGQYTPKVSKRTLELNRKFRVDG